jgi:hypothetical protein
LRRIGSLQPQHDNKSVFEFPYDWDVCCEACPELANYHKADRDVDKTKAVFVSLMSHQRRSETPLAEKFLLMAQEVLVSESPVAPLEDFSILPTPEEVVAVCSRFNFQANPGYPWNLTFSSKGDMMRDGFSTFYYLVCVRFLVWKYFDLTDYTPEQLMRVFAVDPAHAKIKNEVKKVAKEPRIFLMCSVVTEAVEGLFLDSNRAVDKRFWGFIPSCIGIGFSQSDSDRLHCGMSVFEGSTVHVSDVPKMDVSRTEFETFLDYAAVAQQKHAPPDDPIHGILYSAAICSSRMPIFFSDGDVYELNFPGTTKTGQKGTSKFNTATRVRRSYASGFYIMSMLNIHPKHFDFHCRAAGDDAMETVHPLRKHSYDHLCFPIRDFEEVSILAPSFCSTLWPKGLPPIGQRIYKAAAHLLFLSNPTIEQVRAFVDEYCRNPEFPRLWELILERRQRIKNFDICISNG